MNAHYLSTPPLTCLEVEEEPQASTVSSFYEWSCEYFSRPLTVRYHLVEVILSLLMIKSTTEPDSTDPSFHERKFRLRRNREIIKESQQYQLYTGQSSSTFFYSISRAHSLSTEKGKKASWENEIAILENERSLVLIAHTIQVEWLLLPSRSTKLHFTLMRISLWLVTTTTESLFGIGM